LYETTMRPSSNGLRKTRLLSVSGYKWDCLNIYSHLSTVVYIIMRTKLET